MPKKILMIHGHPDADHPHLNDALLQAYEAGATEQGHTVRHLVVAKLNFTLIKSQQEWQKSPVPADIANAQSELMWADHLVIAYPLWLGAMPALLKGFFEQVLRPDFAISANAAGLPWTGKLKGKSARVVVTMGMPAFAYRWFYRSHSLKSFERNILRFCGIAPVRKTIIGLVESENPRHLQKAISTLRGHGTRAE